LSFSCFTFNTNAALNCVPDGAYLDMFAGPYGGFFGFGDEFANIAVGTRIGPLREVNLKFTCSITPGSSKYGVGKKATPGVSKVVVDGNVYYTTGQLSQYGLGYRIWWHEPGGAVHNNSDLTQDSQPNADFFLPFNNGVFSTEVPVRAIFFKINNNFQNTNGAYIPVNIATDLFTLYVADTNFGVDNVAGSIYRYRLNLNDFSSAKRVCTPHVDKTIQFDYTTTGDMSTVPGPVVASTKDFSLNFNCAYMAWYTQGFRMQPVYGVLDAANGVVGIQSGPGYAQGVGIQVLVKDVAPGWVFAVQPVDVDNYTSPWQVVMPNQTYTIPALQYLGNQIHLNPGTAMKSKQVNFRARYYRMPGTLTAGKVESAVIFHFVYN